MRIIWSADSWRRIEREIDDAMINQILYGTGGIKVASRPADNGLSVTALEWNIIRP